MGNTNRFQNLDEISLTEEQVKAANTNADRLNRTTLRWKMKRQFVPPVPLIAYAAACRLSPTAAVVYQLLLREMLLQRADEVYISLDILGICDISQSSYANALYRVPLTIMHAPNRGGRWT